MLLKYLLDLSKTYKTSDYFGAYDISDKFTFLTMILLLFSGAATTYKFFINSPLTCFTPVNPTGENFNDFVTNYVWTHGSVPSALVKDSKIEDLDQWNRALDDSGIHYYQWVPLILLVQCLLLFVCRYLWESACSTNVSHNLNSLVSECRKTSPVCDDQTMKQLSWKFRLVIDKTSSDPGILSRTRISVQNKLGCLGFSRRFGSWMCSRYATFKVATISMCVLQAYVIASIFGISPLDLSEIWQGSSVTTNMKFPRSVVGFVPNVAVLGSFNSYSINCVMTVNIINEKLFIVFQSLFLLLAAMNTISLLLWLIDMGIRARQHQFIGKYLDRFTSTVTQNPIDKFINDHLKSDGIFLLRIINNNCNNHLVRRLVRQLWSSTQSTEDLSHRMNGIVNNYLLSGDQISTYLRGQVDDNSLTVIIDPFCVSEILDGCGSLESLAVCDLRCATLVVAPVNVGRQFWLLFVYDTLKHVSYIVHSLTTFDLPSDVRHIGSTLTEEFNRFCHRQDIQFSHVYHEDRQRQSTLDDSGPLVCGYALHVIRGNALSTPIDVSEIRKHVWKAHPDD